MEVTEVPRVLSGNDQDATMVDIGEKERPPGDPPDKGASWVNKVIGGNRAGMSIPETVIDDEFVSANLCLEFPNGEDGEPVITIGREVLEAMNGLWKRCMIVKILGRNVAISVLSRKLREMWKPTGGMYVMDLPRQFFMIRFEKEDEYLAALTGGPWKVFGSYLMAQAWSPEFDPLNDEIITTPVWVRLSNIPVNFYHKSILMGIAKGLGKPIRVDLTTLNFERGRFARVCVEVNLKKPLKGSVVINGERYFVAYEGLTNICSFCGLYGHMVHTCPRAAHEKNVVSVSQCMNAGAEENRQSQEEDGFTLVRRAGKRIDNSLEKAALVVSGGRGDGGSKHPANIRKKDSENLMVSNKFGSLEVEMESVEVRQEVINLGDNKENEGVVNQMGKGNSGDQGKGVVFGSGTSKGTNGPNGGFKERRMAHKKGGEINGPKFNQIKSNRPTRGLVFGPVSGESDLVVSGKRMRLEKQSIGRAGGCVVTVREHRGSEMGMVSSGTEMEVNSSMCPILIPSETGFETREGVSESISGKD